MINTSSSDEGLAPRRMPSTDEVQGHIRMPSTGEELAPRRVPQADEVEGHIRHLVADEKEQSGHSFIRPDDTDGHSRFGLFLDADQPVKDAAPRRMPSGEPDDVEGHRSR